MEPAERRAAETLLHPIALGAIALLGLNDHLLKSRFPGVVTGKLSDVAGLVFFPALLAAGGEGLLRLVGRRLPVAHLMAAAALATALAFAAVKTLAPANHAYAVVVGALQWPWAAARSIAGGGDLPPLQRVTLVRDVTDLLALPFALASPWLARVSHRSPAGA